METENRLAALQMDPGRYYAEKSAGIGRKLRLELAKSERKGMEERIKASEPVFNARVSQEREICGPNHRRRCIMMDYFYMLELDMSSDRATSRRMLVRMTIHASQASSAVFELEK